MGKLAGPIADCPAKRPRPLLMIKRLTKLMTTAAIGLAICLGSIWGLTLILDEGIAPRCQGRPLSYWLDRAKSQDAAVSNQACLVLSAAIIPQLTDTLFHDTNDSHLRLALIEQLNMLPGVQIHFTTAGMRRANATRALGSIGPRAKSTIPDLIKVLKGNDSFTRPAAVCALGQIHSEPETVVPLLIGLIDDPQDGLPEEAICALGNFGSGSKAAIPKLLPLLKSPDRDTRAFTIGALKQIAPEEAAKAGVR
jgi:HEAT repeat protein